MHELTTWWAGRGGPAGAGVVPVFVPPRSRVPGGDRELDRRWQAKVLGPLHPRSRCRGRSRPVRRGEPGWGRARIEAARSRRPFPEGWALDLQAHPRGRMHHPRRTTPQGAVEVLGRRFEADASVAEPAGLRRGRSRRRLHPVLRPEEARPGARHRPLGKVAYTLPRRRFRE